MAARFSTHRTIPPARSRWSRPVRSGLAIARLALFAVIAAAPSFAVPPGQSDFGRPATIATEDLDGFAALPEDRQALIRTALRVAAESPWLRYKDSGSAPSDGGFDCSGAMFYVLTTSGHQPPRSSAGQWNWLKENGRLRIVPAGAKDLADPAFRDLRPGDLLFWSKSGTEPPRIHHVALYLGKEKKDGLPVMINSTDGRSYRGQKANGYGVYDFRLPRPDSGSRFIGYGSPPGITSDRSNP